MQIGIIREPAYGRTKGPIAGRVYRIERITDGAVRDVRVLRSIPLLDDAAVAKEVEANGFRLVSSQPFLPGSQYMAVFEKK